MLPAFKRKLPRASGGNRPYTDIYAARRFRAASKGESAMSASDRTDSTAEATSAAAIRGLWTRAGRLVNMFPPPAFAGYVVRRFIADAAPQAASGLSYASLLALVPLLAIMLAIISAFPAFSGLEDRILGAIVSDALPPMEADAGAQIRSFVRNATDLTGPGLAGLGVTAILLLSNINGAFNTIWRVSEPRPLAMRLLVYWALLTLGPLLLAVSISVSAPVFAALGGESVAEVARWLVPPWVMSIGIGAVGFAVLFYVVPNRRVHLVHSLAGGLVTALVFEALKAAFGFYLAAVPGYRAVYGAVAAVPIFLVWLYMSWAAVLLGAEVTAALPEWRAYRARAGTAWAGETLALAFALLARLRTAQREGRTLGRGELVAELPATPGDVDGILTPLRRAGVIARTAGGRWVLAVDLSRLPVSRVLGVLSLSLDPGEDWPAAVRAGLGELTAAARDWTDQDVETLLSRAGDAPPAAGVTSPGRGSP
jgi:membrane protein